MDEQDQWQKAIAELYAVFSGYPAPKSLEAAPKHDTVKMCQGLTAVPLHQLSADALGAFAGSALYTVGRIEDYKHFLPRIFELSGKDKEWLGFEAPIIARKLIYADWDRWPDIERSALKQAFKIGWFRARISSPYEVDAPMFLCANGYLENDIAGLLEGWLPLKNEFAGQQLASLVMFAPHGLTDNGYWDEVPLAFRESVQAWLETAAVYSALREAALSSVDPRGWILSEALKPIVRH